MRVANNSAEAPSTSATQPSLSEMRAIVSDLFEPKPRVYWFDLLVTLAIGYPALLVFAHSDGATWWRIGCYLIAVVAPRRQLHS
jgi:hypothetical protein